jgi:hypothetical protein
LLVALVTFGLWTPTQALAAAQRNPDPRTKSAVQVALAPHVPPDQRPIMLAEALSTLREIEDASALARTVAALAPHLPPDLMGEALAAVRVIRDARNRAEALVGLAPYLLPDQRQAVSAEAMGGTCAPRAT